jgi:ATP-binding cassette subfamily C (CFTR/MRP) protein 1
MIDGMNLGTLDRQTLRTRLIAIPQDSFLHDQLTWKQNLEPGNNSTLEECENVLRDVGVLDEIHTSGGLEAAAKPDTLSHGQKQLFGLARAVLKGRQRAKFASRSQAEKDSTNWVTSGGLLLLDEISSSVDEATEAIMHRIIMREFAAYTIIAVAHRFSSVKNFDTVIVMEGGKIKERGTASDILANFDTSATT